VRKSAVILVILMVISGEAQLTVKGVTGNYSVELNWIQSGDPQITGNCVYRGRGDKGELQKLACVEPPIVTFTDTHVHDGYTYRYAVTAVEGDQQSDYSNRIKVKIPEQ
jgi:fibronectin type 3 domain-containing protein